MLAPPKLTENVSTVDVASPSNTIVHWMLACACAAAALASIIPGMHLMDGIATGGAIPLLQLLRSRPSQNIPSASVSASASASQEIRSFPSPNVRNSSTSLRLEGDNGGDIGAFAMSVDQQAALAEEGFGNRIGSGAGVKGVSNVRSRGLSDEGIAVLEIERRARSDTESTLSKEEAPLRGPLSSRPLAPALGSISNTSSLSQLCLCVPCSTDSACTCCPCPSQCASAPILDRCSAAASPRVLCVIFIMAGLACLAGDLNFLAGAVSVTHLITYAIVNFVCLLLALMKGSAFRPRWGHYRRVVVSILIQMYWNSTKFISMHIVKLLLFRSFHTRSYCVCAVGGVRCWAQFGVSLWRCSCRGG